MPIDELKPLAMAKSQREGLAFEGVAAPVKMTAEEAAERIAALQTELIRRDTPRCLHGEDCSLCNRDYWNNVAEANY